MSRELAGWSRAALAGWMLLIVGCTAAGTTKLSLPPEPTVSVETLEYYPYLVKGYQNSFPHRTMIVLTPIDARDLTSPNAAPKDGQPAIGIVTDQSGNIVQRLFGGSLTTIVQGALERSAAEAGFQSSSENQSIYIGGERNADYIMASRITECWVKKHRGPDGRYGPTWSNEANFRLEVTIYKPPFKVPFWEGSSNQEYWDPPIGSFGLGPDDEAGIYDQPGQVLSVAMTRAVAGVFQRDDFRALVLGDHIRVR